MASRRKRGRASPSSGDLEENATNERRKRPTGPPTKMAFRGTYPESDTPPITEAETAMIARRHAVQAADDAKRGPLGPPDFRQGMASDRLRVSGMSYEEAAEFFRTGIPQ